jgi:hypothetical protein
VHNVVRLVGREGLSRVLEGTVGMTFVVDHFTDTVDNRGQIAHVRDYRYSGGPLDRPFQIWSIGPEGYERV